MVYLDEKWNKSVAKFLVVESMATASNFEVANILRYINVATKHFFRE